MPVAASRPVGRSGCFILVRGIHRTILHARNFLTSMGGLESVVTTGVVAEGATGCASIVILIWNFTLRSEFPDFWKVPRIWPEGFSSVKVQKQILTAHALQLPSDWYPPGFKAAPYISFFLTALLIFFSPIFFLGVASSCVCAAIITALMKTLTIWCRSIILPARSDTTVKIRTVELQTKAYGDR